MAKRRAARAPRRAVDWVDGVTTTTCFTVLANIQNNINLWTPATLDDDATVVRIVGTIHCAPLMTDDLVGQNCGTLAMGIQVVNRAKNSTGVARDPSILDDREGSEWMWLGQAFFSNFFAADLSTTPSATVIKNDCGFYNPYVDIQVKRKIDKSQDELLLSLTPHSAPAGVDWRVSANLRVLLMAT